MADLFISYAREDRDTAARLAGCLQQHGWSVWWSNRGHLDSESARAKQKVLTEAHAVLVLWSKHSLTNAQVLSDAGEGLSRQVLLPISLERGLAQPQRFQHLHPMDLIEWSGDMSESSYIELERAIARIARPTLAEFYLGGIAVEPKGHGKRDDSAKAGLPLRVYGYSLVGLLVGAVALVILTPTSTSDVRPSRASAVYSTAPVPARIWPDAVRASSVAEHHSAQAAFDGSLGTAWVSNPTREHSDEWIQISFSQRTYIAHAVLQTGYQANTPAGGDLFYDYARPRELRIITDQRVSGSGTRIVQIGEYEREIDIDVGRSVSFIRFDLPAIWSPVDSGIGRHGAIAISEIQLFGYPAP